MIELKKIRMYVMVILFTVMIAVLIKRLYQIQVIGGESYSKNFEVKVSDTLPEIAARGNIYDRNGNLLAGNKLIFTITMVDSGSYKTNREKQLKVNSIIRRIQKTVESNGENLEVDIKIRISEKGEYEYTVEGTALLRFKADIFGKKNPGDMSEEQENITAEDMVKYLAGNSRFGLYGEGKTNYSIMELIQYGLEDSYSKEEELEIVGIRYMLSLNVFQKYRPVTIARNISDRTVAYILENRILLPGTDIAQEYDRIYEGGEAFAHILGYTGKISSEELEQLGENNTEYSKDSIVGKSGIEQYMETTLQGRNGEKQITINQAGKEIEAPVITKKVSAGEDVILSIDMDLQRAVYQILEQTIAGIVSDNLINAKEFNKTAIRDSSEIRIPVYDVYKAFIKNNIIDLSLLKHKEASELEQTVLKKFEYKKEAILKQVYTELMNGDIPFKELSKEMQEYISFAVNENQLLNLDLVDKTNSVYIAWKEKKEVSPRKILLYGLEKGWIDTVQIPSEQKYSTLEEIYQQFILTVRNQLGENTSFDKIIFQNMIDKDEITGGEVCELLYEQKVLSKTDGDYKKLKDGLLSTYEFIKKKINQLEITPAQLALDPCSGSAVVVEASTGKILANVTYPGYDNNKLSNRMDTKYYLKLYNDLSLPFYNRATQQLTAPGSTFKPITVIAGLQEKVITPDTSVYCDGIFDKVVPSLKCWRHSGHGEIKNAAEALSNSCNDYLSEISYRLGMKQRGDYKDSQALSYIQEYAGIFDLDKKSGIEITESLPQITKDYGIPSAIGQGTHNYTTIQLARYTNTLATRGDSSSMSVIQGVGRFDGKIEEKKSILQSKVELENYVWDTVSDGMQLFAENNGVLKDMKIKVAGKTGTAQESKVRPDHSLFIGYAPAKAPEISVAVRIANGYGSSNATHVGKDIFNYYFNLEDKESILTGQASKSSNISTD
jgi:penicillin-binding protein 2